MTSQTRDREVESRLRARDVRYTSGRKRVVAALASAHGPRSAAELNAELLPDVPLSSLYRTLAVLEDAGIVSPHFGARGVTRYELAEWLRGHHHHLICVDCGSVDDVAVPSDLETEVRRLVDDIGMLAEFAPVNHALEIEGRCARCA
ncbi:MAG: transcriptional repressor [Acidimicrobiia bacterium]|nr:transcriptional repressor [Acidimicrobiia bacterium]MDH4307522.1 transcriptional repressor [Acidimicrobiia bacterium]MDH5293145.1 transcriptional repressor [Acidimicrobiia bacterium]